MPAARLVPALPWVETDDAEIARLAFGHLRSRGLTSFAYCGDPNYNWSNWREGHFVEAVRGAGFACAVFPSGAAAADEKGRKTKKKTHIPTLPRTRGGTHRGAPRPPLSTSGPIRSGGPRVVFR